MSSSWLRWSWMSLGFAVLLACAASPAKPAAEPSVQAPSQAAPPPPPPPEAKTPSAYEQRWQTACTEPGALGRCPAPFDRPGVFFDAKGKGQYTPPGLCGVAVQESDRAAHTALEPKRKALRACFRGAAHGAWVDVASDGSRPAVASPELPARTASCVAALLKRSLPSTGPQSVKRVVVLSVGSARDGQPSLSKESVNAMITAHAEEVGACYDGALEVWPGLRGRMAPSVVIWFDGTVALVHTQESSLDNPALECCINTAVRAWRFGPPDDGNIAIVNLPFVLGPQP
jgi:hypothetical protein